MGRYLFPFLLLLVTVTSFGAFQTDAPQVFLQEAATEPPVEAVAQVQSAQLSSEELAARAAEGRWILLRTVSFDPLNETPPEFVRGEAASGTLGKYFFLGSL